MTTVFGDGSTHRYQFGPGWAFAPSAGDWADPLSLSLYLIRRRDRGEIASEDVDQILSQWPRGEASIENSGGGSIGLSGAMTAIGSWCAVARICGRGNRISRRHIIRATRGYLSTVEAESYPAFCVIHRPWARCLFRT